MAARVEATVDDLYRVPVDQKAELVHGEIVLMPLTGGLPGYSGSTILVSLHAYACQTNCGHALGDNVGFLINLPHRRSLSPDVAFYTGKLTMKFLDGAPVFAVGVRSENDYGPAAETELAAKRTDYFAAGTLVVWDVDLLSDDVIRVYRAGAPHTPTVYRRGDLASRVRCARVDHAG